MALLNVLQVIILLQAYKNVERPETTYNKQETTLNDLERPRATKKRHETTYPKQETTWNNLQQAKNILKKEQMLTSWIPSTWKIINWRDPMSQRSNISILHL